MIVSCMLRGDSLQVRRSQCGKHAQTCVVSADASCGSLNKGSLVLGNSRVLSLTQHLLRVDPEVRQQLISIITTITRKRTRTTAIRIRRTVAVRIRLMIMTIRRILIIQSIAARQHGLQSGTGLSRTRPRLWMSCSLSGRSCHRSACA